MSSSEDSDDFFMDTDFDDDERIKQAMEEQEKGTPSDEKRLIEEDKEEKTTSSSSEPEYDSPVEEEVKEPVRRSSRTRNHNANVVVVDEEDGNDSDEEYVEEPPRKRTRSSVEEKAEENVDENDLFFQNLAKRKLQSVTPEPDDGKDDDNRVYYVQFISRIDGTRGKSLQVKALGKHEFNKLATAALNGFMKTFHLPSVMKSLYTVEKTAIYWNKVKILGFMTCNSLKIPQKYENEVSYIEVKLIPRDQETQFIREELESITTEGDEIETTTTQPEKKNKTIEEFEKELREDAQDIQDIIEIQEEEEESQQQIMKLALVGQDNKKIMVNVRQTTVFDKLIQYYRIQKQLPQRARITLVFDDEELNPQDTVASQDIEDEDMIEVRVDM